MSKTCYLYICIKSKYWCVFGDHNAFKSKQISVLKYLKITILNGYVVLVPFPFQITNHGIRRIWFHLWTDKFTVFIMIIYFTLQRHFFPRSHDNNTRFCICDEKWGNTADQGCKKHNKHWTEMMMGHLLTKRSSQLTSMKAAFLCSASHTADTMKPCVAALV